MADAAEMGSGAIGGGIGVCSAKRNGQPCGGGISSLPVSPTPSTFRNELLARIERFIPFFSQRGGQYLNEGELLQVAEMLEAEHNAQVATRLALLGRAGAFLGTGASVGLMILTTPGDIACGPGEACSP